MCSQYVSGYSDHCHHLHICECCVLWSINHHHDGCTCFHLCGPDNLGSARCGSATTVDSEEYIKGLCWPHSCATAATTSTPESSDICQLCHQSLTGKFLFQSWAFHWFLCHVFDIIQCLLHAFRFLCGFATVQPFWVYPKQAYLPPGDGLSPMPGVHWEAAPPTALSWGKPPATNLSVPNDSSNMVGYTALGAQQRVTWSICLPYMMGRGPLLQVVLHPMT